MFLGFFSARRENFRATKTGFRNKHVHQFVRDSQSVTYEWLANERASAPASNDDDEEDVASPLTTAAKTQKICF